MADITLIARSPLGGRSISIGACNLREVADTALTSLAVPQGGDKAFDAMLKKQCGVARPDPRISAAGRDLRVICTASDQMLVLHAAGKSIDPGDKGYATDQTGNWVVLELSGSGAEDALRRLCPIDLVEANFPTDASARTVMEHMGAIVVRTGSDSFLLMSASSSARSFWHAAEVSMRNIA